VNEQDDGSKRINIRFTPKEERSPQQRNQARGQQRQQRNTTRRDPGDSRQGYGPPDGDMNDDIPF
jgi:hypothetical protein